MEIEITIAPDGTTTTRVKGGTGRGCKDATKAIRDALGVTTSDRTLPEYHEQVSDTDHVRSGGRR